MARDIVSEYFIIFWYPAITLNLLCMPALWFFTKSQFDKNFRLSARHYWHIVPAWVSLVSSIIFYAPMTAEQIETERAFMENGGENLPAVINDILLFGQFFIYFATIFFYIRKRKKYLQNNFADTDYIETQWTTGFLIIFFVLFFVVFVAYMINPRTDAWLIPILNVAAMAYLVYVVMYHSTAAYLHRLPDPPAEQPKPANGNSAAAPTMTESQMKEICDRVAEYLQTSKAYINPDFSIHNLASETGIQWKNISVAINGYLHKNFFDLVNEMRVEKAKRLLRDLSSEYSTDSVYLDCGFRSRSSYYMTFKKFEETTPAQWRKKAKL
jgi:AraC-like DNA-binding protein